MDDRDYELLLLLNKTKNITHASEELFISQSTLSKRIQAIEKELGVQLLIRSRQGIHFTPVGEEVLKLARKIHHHRREIDLAVADSLNIVKGTIKLGVSINFAYYCLPQTLKTFKEEYPLVDVNIQTDQSRHLYKALWKNQLDLAIVRGDYSDWFGEKLLLFRERICLIHTEQSEEIDFLELPYIERKSDQTMEHQVWRWLKENNMSERLTSTMSVDSMQTIVEMVSAGLGWAIVPEICLDGFKGHIIPLTYADGIPLERSTYLLYSSQLMELPQVKAFIELIRAKKGELYV